MEEEEVEDAGADTPSPFHTVPRMQRHRKKLTEEEWACLGAEEAGLGEESVNIHALSGGIEDKTLQFLGGVSKGVSAEQIKRVAASLFRNQPPQQTQPPPNAADVGSGLASSSTETAHAPNISSVAASDPNAVLGIDQLRQSSNG